MKKLLWTIWIAASCAILFELYRYQKDSAGRSSGMMVAEIVKKNGDVSYRNVSDFDWISAGGINNLYENELFSTGQGANALLSLGNGMRLELEENTVIKLDPPKNLGITSEIYLVSGQVKAVVKRPEVSKKSNKGPSNPVAPTLVIRSESTRFEVSGKESELALARKEGSEKIAIKTVSGDISTVVGDHRVSLQKTGVSSMQLAAKDPARILKVPVEVATSKAIVAKPNIVTVGVSHPPQLPSPKITKKEEDPLIIPPEALYPSDQAIEAMQHPTHAKQKKPDSNPKFLNNKKSKTLLAAQLLPPPKAPEPPPTKTSSSTDIATNKNPKTYTIHVTNSDLARDLQNALKSHPDIAIEETKGSWPSQGMFACNADQAIAYVKGPSARSKDLDTIRRSLGAKLIFQGDRAAFIPRDKVGALFDKMKSGKISSEIYFFNQGVLVPISPRMTTLMTNIEVMVNLNQSMVFLKKVAPYSYD